MAIIIGPDDSNGYFVGQASLQLTDGDVAYADDVNALTQKTNTAFDAVEVDIDALVVTYGTAQSWASNDQGDKPDPTGSYYSARAYTLEATDWANATGGATWDTQTIHLADGTTTSAPSASSAATEAGIQATAAGASAAAALASENAAALSESNAADSEAICDADVAILDDYIEATLPVDHVFTASSGAVNDFDLTPYAPYGVYVDSVMVWMNGMKLEVDVDYTVTGNVVTLTTDAEIGDIIDIHAGGLSSGPPNTGFHRLTEGGNTGWRLIDADPANYGDIGQYALDASYSGAPSTTNGATGDYTFAVGAEVRAQGGGSCAVGSFLHVDGDVAFGCGTVNTVTGRAGFVGGESCSVTGNQSIAIGYNLLSPNDYMASFGQYNYYSDANLIFTIGNGVFGTPGNALQVFNDGTAELPQPTTALIDARGSKAIPTVEWVQNALSDYAEWVAPPLSASDTGTEGQIAKDSSYLYICVSTDTWMRVAIATW